MPYVFPLCQQQGSLAYFQACIASQNSMSATDPGQKEISNLVPEKRIPFQYELHHMSGCTSQHPSMDPRQVIASRYCVPAARRQRCCLRQFAQGTTADGRIRLPAHGEEALSRSMFSLSMSPNRSESVSPNPKAIRSSVTREGDLRPRSISLMNVLSIPKRCAICNCVHFCCLRSVLSLRPNRPLTLSTELYRSGFLGFRLMAFKL